MKLLLVLLAATRLAYSLPHGPDADDDDMPKPKAKAPTSSGAVAPVPAVAPTSSPVAPNSNKTPAGCRALNTDTEFPSAAVWKAELPKAVSRKDVLAEYVKAPDYKVVAMKYSDVVDAVKFAGKHNLRLSVIASGHDFLGRNDAPSGIVLDLSNLGGITVHESFEPTAKGAAIPGKANVIKPNSGKQAAATIGAGITTQVLNNALHKSKLVSVGAAHGSVTVSGGYGQSGGHSPISDLYGLGADQFLEFQVVTADGEIKIANKVSNPDLFWALRGGGGSTFGVVLQATIKVHPTIPVTLVTWQINSTKENSEGIWDAYAELHRHFDDIQTNHGGSGYYYHYGSRMTGAFLQKGEHAGKAKAEAVWVPILKKMTSYPDVIQTNLTITEYPWFKQYFDARFGSIDGGSEKAPTAPWDQAGTRLVTKRHGPGEMAKEPVAAPMANLDSRLLGARHIASKNLTAALKGAFPAALPAKQQIIQGHLVSGGKVHKPDDDVSVLPAWRTALTHVIGYNTPGKASVDSLRLLAPDSGAYPNEAFAMESDWKKTFWGSNYEKLSQLKTKYDPNMLFYVSPGINADLYEARGERLCKRTTPYTLNTAPRSDNPNSGRVQGTIN